MRRLLLTVLVTILSINIHAQTTVIPDGNFEQALINQGYDSALDGLVLNANISSVTHLDVSSQSIADLTGIGSFTSLTNLQCNDNALTFIDVSQNLSLTYFDCSFNPISVLDISMISALDTLVCQNTFLPNIDVTLNFSLKYLDCSDNQFSSIDVTQNVELRHFDCADNLITSIDVLQNSGLEYLDCSSNAIPSFDVSTNLLLSYLDCSKDVITNLDVSQNDILTYLDCSDTPLTSVDVTLNPILAYLDCSNDSLTTIDVSQNAILAELYCDNCYLTTLDVNSNPVLTHLRCFENQLTSLDVSSNPALIEFWCYYNQIASLDVTQNPSLKNFRCFYNQLTSIDVTQNAALVDFRCGLNQLTTLDLSQNPVLGNLNCSVNNLVCINANNSTNSLGAADFTQNPVSCISVFDVITATNNFYYESWMSFNLDCGAGMTLDNDVTQFGNQLTADQNGALYQWLDCDNGLAVIPGEVNQSFTAGASGNYAVQITLLNCTGGGDMVDTSTCVTVDCQGDIDNDVNQIGSLLTAVMSGASYQWLDCENNYAVINGETSQSYTPSMTGYYAVEISNTNSCGTIDIDTSTCHLVNYNSLYELNNSPKQLLKIVDFMGRETPYRPGTILIYVYSDGTTERVFKME